MPDITLCKGNDCPLKETCYRYKAKPCEYQSYFMESPYKDGDCSHYWEMSSKSSKKLDKVKQEIDKKSSKVRQKLDKI